MGHIRKLSSVAFFVVLISSIGLVNIPYMPQASADGFVDLDQPIFDSSELINIIASGVLGDAQRIFPTVTGDLVAVDITVVSIAGNPSGDMIVRIYDSTISLVASESITFSTIPMPALGPAIFHVDFTTPPALIAGNEYFIDVSTSASTDVQWHFHNVDQIVGNGIFNGGNQPLRDYQFTTHMDTGGCVVDQSNFSGGASSESLDLSPSPTGLNDAQQFSLSTSGDVTTVNVEITTEAGNPPGNLFVRIYDPAGTSVIVEGSIPFPLIAPDTPHIISVPMPVNSLTDSTLYSIDVFVDSATNAFWTYDSGNPYAPGISVRDGFNESTDDFNFSICLSGPGSLGIPELVAFVNILPECSVNTNGEADFGSLSPGFPSSEEQLDLLVQGSADADIHYSGDHWFGFPPTVPIMNVFTTAFDLIGGTTHAAKIPFPHVSDPIPAPGNVGIIISPATQLTFLQNLPFLLDLSFSGFLTQDLFVTFTCVIDFLSMTGSPASGPVSTPVGGMTSIEIRDYQSIVDPTSTAIITISIEQDSTGGVAVLTCAVCINGVATLPAAAAGTVLVPIDLLISTPGTFTLIAQSESIIPFETASFTLS